MNTAQPGGSAPNGPTASQRLYFAVWRWHFYAALVVVPFLILAASTGMIMVWFTAISPEYGDRIAVAATTQTLSITDQADAALAQYPDARIGQYIAPYDGDTPALFRVDQADGNRIIALDPYSGQVLQDRAQDGTWNDFATRLHGELFMGTKGDLILEIAAGLALLMVATGLYLVWPRNGNGIRAILLPNLAAKGRAWWKSLHQVVGFWVSLLLVFFLVSGMAWTGIWGGKFVQAWSTFPAEKWDNVPLSNDIHAQMNHDALKTVPWALEQTLMPESGSTAGITGTPVGSEVTLETVVALGRSIGFQGRFQIAVPADETGVWTLSQDSMSYDNPDPTSDRTVHVDQYTGKILASVGFADYSLAGKSMAVGIALHEGQMGLWNVVLNLTYCLFIIFLAVSGVIIWWKRRPAGAGRLVAPPLSGEVPLFKGAVFIALFLSMAFPMLGLTLLAVMLIDLLVLRNIRSLRRLVS